MKRYETAVGGSNPKPASETTLLAKSSPARSRVQDLAKRFESNSDHGSTSPNSLSSLSSEGVSHRPVVPKRRSKFYQNSRTVQGVQKFNKQGTEFVITSSRVSNGVIRKKSSLARRFKSSMDICYSHRGVEINVRKLAGTSGAMPKSHSEEPISSYGSELLLDAKNGCFSDPEKPRHDNEHSAQVPSSLNSNKRPEDISIGLNADDDGPSTSTNPLNENDMMVQSIIASFNDLSTSTHGPGSVGTLRPKQPPPKVPPKPSHLAKPQQRTATRHPHSDESIASTSVVNNVMTVEICDTNSSSTNTSQQANKSEVSPKPMPWPRSRPTSISRKPTMKPPPPPVPSAATLPRKPVHGMNATSNHRTNNSSSSYTSDNNTCGGIYQSLSSPDSPTNGMEGQKKVPNLPVPRSNFVRKGSGFYGKDRRSRPSVPTIPPPSPPKCPMIRSYHDDERFDELYEDIEHSIIMDEEPDPPTVEPKKSPKKGISSFFYSPKFTKRNEKSHQPANVYRAYSSDTEENENEPRQKMPDESQWSNMMKRRSHFGTWGAGKKNRMLKRPPSSGIEFDKLLRIKSEIQLNLSKKVEKIKSKVASGNESSRLHRSKRASSVFYVDPRTLQTDTSPSDPKNFEDKTIDDVIYGDDWSSDDDEPTTTEELTQHSSDGIYQARNSLENHSSNTSEHYFTSGRSLPACGHYELDYGTYNKFDEHFDSRDSSGQDSLLAEIESAYFQAKTKHLPDIIPTMSEQQEEHVSSERDSFLAENSPSVVLNKTPRNQMEDFAPSCAEHSAEAPIYQGALSPDVDYDAMSARGVYTSRLPEPQPLYQIYMLQEQEKMLEESAIPALASLRIGPSSSSSDSGNGRDTDGVEADSVCDPNEHDEMIGALVRRQSSSVSTDSGRGGDSSSRVTSNTSMRRERLTAASVFGSQRSLWCELTEVKTAGILETLDENSKKLQEAFFEVITSEASYLRSINILISNFMMAPELLGTRNSIISHAERKHLFSNILAIRDCSERLLCELENRLEENIILSDVCDILCDHFEKHFDAYQIYCSNQVYQDRILKRLKALNSQFLNVVQRIESDRLCQGLDMRSFLMLPMQRVTRYRLLVQAILDRVAPESPQHGTAARALILANQVVRNCNEGARRMERTEQLLDIERRLVYKSADLKRIPLVTTGRYVVKSGPLVQLQERRSKGLLQSRNRSRSLFLFLFSDLLMVAKKRQNGAFVCKDYAPRRFVVVEPIEPHSHKIPPGSLEGLASKPHLFLCVLLQNAHGRQVELVLNTESESDRERWLSAMRPPTCMNPDEKIYAEWDCPQAVAVHQYLPDQEDELDLSPGDLINILRKMPDGWFYGEKARDGKQGWFPSSYIQQVLNDHVRANNYKQRLRVIEAAAMYQTPQSQKPSEKSESGQKLVNRLRRLSNPKGIFNVSV